MGECALAQALPSRSLLPRPRPTCRFVELSCACCDNSARLPGQPPVRDNRPGEKERKTWPQQDLSVDHLISHTDKKLIEWIYEELDTDAAYALVNELIERWNPEAARDEHAY